MSSISLTAYHCLGFSPVTAGSSNKESQRAEGVFLSKRRKYSPEFKREAIALTQ